MAKNYLKNSKTRKTLTALLAAAAITCTGFAAACAKTDDSTSNEDLATKQEDTQLLKNGNFEFFNYPSAKNLESGKAKYLIKTPDSWSRGGDSSNAMSGIIGTSESAWSQLTDSELTDKLEFNDSLSSTDDNYVNYNGMKARDILYKDTYAALLKDDAVADSYIKNQSYEKYFGITESDGKYYIGETQVYRSAEEDNIEYYFDEACTKSVRKQLIANPGTHFTVQGSDADGYYYMNGDEKVNVYKGENGEYYSDEDLLFPCTNVLMIHNYPSNSYYNGISQYYTSQSITLESNTAAEISVWVKTSDLKFDKGYSQLNDQDRGAFIEVVQTVSGTEIDSFLIKSINTEKILADNDIADNLTVNETSNGWLKYTIYVEACDFGTSTIQLRLGLGQDADNTEKCTGYAFFDDVKVEKFLNLQEKGCSYGDNAQKIDENVTYTLTSDEADKTFVADKAVRNGANDYRNAKDFKYLINLTSASSDSTAVAFSGNVTARLTYEKSDNDKYYASAESIDSKVIKKLITVEYNNGGEKFLLPKNFAGAVTSDDILGAFPYNETSFGNSPYAAKLSKALTAEGAALPNYEDSILLMHSAYGAAYTSTITSSAFSLDGGESVIVSFWVKTSDMSNKTAATFTLIDTADDENTASFTLDTTGKTTDFGDTEDIYNGWVECFFFVKNDFKEGEKKEFKIDFSFGNTGIINTTVFNYGYAAIADMQTLKVENDVYDLATTGDYAVKFVFSDEDDTKTGASFDEASGITNIKNGIANLSKYSGYNGGSSNVSDNAYSAGIDEKNTNTYAGLINFDEISNYEDLWKEIYSAFGGDLASYTDAQAAWAEVFGNSTKCYQPAIIVNKLRTYTELVTANENNYTDYYVIAEDEFEGEVFENNGKRFRKVSDADEYDENTEYYSLVSVCNYGFVGSENTVSSGGYATVSVRVKVSGDAKAYVYLVDTVTGEVLTFDTPEYTFYYDNEGNVLSDEYDEDWKENEHREHIVYKLRTDGLYEDDNGALFANTYNLIKSYKHYKYENNTFYKDGKLVSFDDLVEGEKYYSDAECTTLADHYLVTSDGNRVYEYADGSYYYLVEGKRNVTVESFKPALARYISTNDSFKYSAEISAADCNPAINDGWVTVNFFIHAGSESIKYRLEVWSGDRSSYGVDAEGNYAEGAVAFNSNTNYTLTDDYSTQLQESEQAIIDEIVNNLLKPNEELFNRIDTKDNSLEYFVQLVKDLITEGKLTQEQFDALDLQNKYGYTTKYYAYTLYDSAAYQPFNATVAKDGETGYDYSVTDEISQEKLAYFTFIDAEENARNFYADYSTVNQNITMGTADDSTDDDSTSTENNSGKIWLLASSIILVIALLFALAALLLKDTLKKRRRSKDQKLQQKNNFRQRKRYIKKLHLVETESDEAESATEDTAEPETDEVETTEAAEEPAAETVEEPATDEEPETPATEDTAPAETEAPATEETPDETPADEVPPEDKE